MASTSDGTKPFSPGIKHGTHDYVQYNVGGVHSKIIISATHGGNLRPECIPSRSMNPERKLLDPSTAICINSDVYTKEMANMLRDEIQRLMTAEQTPHLITSNLHRSRVDMNRNVLEGCMKIPQAITAYEEFHGFISEACQSVGTGLLLDIHGHTHNEGLVELGYLIHNRDLEIGRLDPEKSSIRALALRSPYAFEELVRGPVSFGTLLQNEGIEVVPSLHHPRAEGCCFTGGYTVLKHGSVTSGTVDAVQVEIHRKHRCAEQAPTLIAPLARAAKKFIDLHYRDDC